MAQPIVVTISLAEEAAREEATDERIEDAAFVATRPHPGENIAEWVEATKYKKGEFVLRNGMPFEAAEDNEKKDPLGSENADYKYWIPRPFSEYPLQNPSFTTNDKWQTLKTREQIVGAPVPIDAEIYPYSATTAYKRGMFATEAGQGYEVLAATTGEAPSTHPAKWRLVGPAIPFGQ